jgi:thiamine kinase-like enzyme
MYVSRILISKVKSFLKEEGYKISKVSLRNRCLCSTIEKEGTSFFMKMALRPEGNDAIRNEYTSSLFLEKELKNLSFVRIRRIIKLDMFLFREISLCYFISEFIIGRPFAHLSHSYKQNKSNMKDAAVLAYALSKIRPWRFILPRNRQAGEHLYTSALALTDKKGPYVKQAINIIHNSKNTVKTTYGHGDFCPWHLYLNSDKLTLIDSEHAGEKPRYYDVAHFYMRLRQNLGKKGLATRFLTEFVSLLPSDEKMTFWSEFKPVLAERTIGHLWEIQTKKVMGFNFKPTSVYPLLREIVTDRVI